MQKKLAAQPAPAAQPPGGTQLKALAAQSQVAAMGGAPQLVPREERVRRDRAETTFKTDEHIRLAESKPVAGGTARPEKWKVGDEEVDVDFDPKTRQRYLKGEPWDPPEGSKRVAATPPKATNLTKQWVMKPDSAEPELAFINPKDPKGFVGSDGAPLPEGTKAVATPVQQRLYGAVQGYYYYFRGQGDSDEVARDKAGALFTQREGVHLGRVQQQASIDEALSGISLGSGFGAGVKGPNAPATKLPEQPTGVGVAEPKKPPATIGHTGQAQQQKEQDDILFYLGNVLGTQGRSGKASQVRSMAGQKALAKFTGFDPMALNVALV
jgi:hypothetical protein